MDVNENVNLPTLMLRGQGESHKNISTLFSLKSGAKKSFKIDSNLGYV
jgi:hypothetical protein